MYKKNTLMCTNISYLKQDKAKICVIRVLNDAYGKEISSHHNQLLFRILIKGKIKGFSNDC